MSDLQERIAALPEWGDPDAAEFDDEAAMALRDSLAAALARLALAREWIEGCAFFGHHWNCETRSVPGALRCDCGRDALLKALPDPASYEERISDEQLDHLIRMQDMLRSRMAGVLASDDGFHEGNVHAGTYRALAELKRLRRELAEAKAELGSIKAVQDDLRYRMLGGDAENYDILAMSDEAAFRKAMRRAWECVGRVPAGQPGSYTRGREVGFADALRTVEANYELAKKDYSRFSVRCGANDE